MKTRTTIQDLQDAREAENRATDFDGFSAYDINESHKKLMVLDPDLHEFPISGDALQRARHYQEQQ